ncbi:hypothetical protein QA648_17875 [Rhizobium sp. CB3171]|uniref:hypothetical protein n=1 Tax=Rhizobium sp. CB3171 TaxID=3039157 RepID=UPI0024B1FFEA|nr:hypothetical protein [Rhizobium sp. CB3171]WFU01946.1 hypothetical protein QA648_17875 [Rhizobium sp. CB3171]
MHKGWHISASFAAFLVLDSECWAEENSPLNATLDGIDVGATVAEFGGIESPTLKGLGKAAGGAGMVLDIYSTIQEIKNSQQDITSNDVAPLGLPLLALNPVGETVLTAYGAYKFYSFVVSPKVQQETPINFSLDVDPEWERRLQDNYDKGRRSYAEAQAASLKHVQGWLSPTATSTPDCGSAEGYNQPGTTDCAANEPEATGTQTGWRQTSFNASYDNPPPLADQCFELPDTIEAYTKMQAHELTSSMGCTITNLSVVNTNNSVFTYSCQNTSVSTTSGSFEIYMTDTKIRTIRHERNTHVGEMEEEASYERCDLPPGAASLTNSASGTTGKQ